MGHSLTAPDVFASHVMEAGRGYRLAETLVTAISTGNARSEKRLRSDNGSLCRKDNQEDQSALDNRARFKTKPTLKSRKSKNSWQGFVPQWSQTLVSGSLASSKQGIGMVINQVKFISKHTFRETKTNALLYSNLPVFEFCRDRPRPCRRRPCIRLLAFVHP